MKSKNKKNPHAQAMARLRASKLSPERRSEIAKLAVETRELKKRLKTKDISATPKDDKKSENHIK